MKEIAKIELDGKKFELPITEGTENEKGIDISKLRAETGGYITLDPGFKNTGSTKSAITYLDGENGILRYRGYPIEQLAEKASFLEVSFLLIYGELPSKEELDSFKASITNHTLVHEDMKQFFEAYPAQAHPMGILASMVCSLSTFYPESLDPNRTPEAKDLTIHRLIAKLPTLAAWSFKNAMRHPFMYPKNNLEYCSNFMHMMFAMPTNDYEMDPVVVSALNKLLILHADHEQNCSTSTVRVVGSSHANLYASISAGISALWGPLHGGANQAVIEMLQKINDDGGDVDKWVAKAKDKNDPFRLMGFGHRVYKNFDPRATIIKGACDEVLEKMGVDDPLLDIAKKLEKVALEDEYFKARNLYPNVDFYSGIIYKAIGIPTEMFTVMFAIGRLPGWIAQWKEMIENGEPIGRPRQIYTGANERNYVAVENRQTIF
ncbi:MAG: citrate synthase [Crocinitomicaceae bacterium]|jgi:citrate synthase|nr:citrate synthase [Crocinitomicaceae bacterium]MDA9169412.1 citrate synthase [Crocinitomicaceae bacterium]MDA9881172.1 citrate synthase [Crocinitomicaceae bacterium]MDG1035384.1 citrate synthase [Crocinitomicaceae bacterium]MDG1741826.1 citrate synthase [Crocinitomicaceae bacterium]